MARTEPPVCRSAPKWIRDRFKNRSALAALTGQDHRALSAFVHLVELYAVADLAGRGRAVEAMKWAVICMQPSVRHLAKASIPHVLDWGDEGPLWDRIGDKGTQ